MYSKNFLKSLFTAGISIAGISFSALISSQQKVHAYSGNPCAAEGSTASEGAMSADCDGTPEVMKVKFFEFGLCTSDPLTSSTFSRANCEKAWESEAGITVDIPACMSTDGCTLQGEVIRPANGTYSHVYLIANTHWDIKGRVYYNNETYYTTSVDKAESAFYNYSTPTNNVNNYETYTNKMTSMGGSGWGANGCFDWSESIDGQTPKAVLTNNLLVTATNQAECTASTKLIGSSDLATPITITSKTRNYQLTWDVTYKGLWVDHDAGNDPDGIGAGPFSVDLTVSE
ncbi:putative protein family PM-13 [Prochlorococcus marinus str. MIT 9302]|uniref:Uncharacterized protein n=1 Tax=Prochlorococcus marinus str. MIT 9302 TaxID=74545 RepID=A0A0A2A7G3_PROMR|nr:hypothetical protein [Prochlorococcus marinus]KGF97842.1 putative protein family PM-13 [Prochlorococcus marinus str. MIT 9302]